VAFKRVRSVTSSGSQPGCSADPALRRWNTPSQRPARTTRRRARQSDEAGRRHSEALQTGSTSSNKGPLTRMSRQPRTVQATPPARPCASSTPISFRTHMHESEGARAAVGEPLGPAEHTSRGDPIHRGRHRTRDGRGRRSATRARPLCCYARTFDRKTLVRSSLGFTRTSPGGPFSTITPPSMSATPSATLWQSRSRA